MFKGLATSWPAGARHGHPLLIGGVAHNVAQRVNWGVRILSVPEEQEPVAGIQEEYVLNPSLLREEREGMIDVAGRHRISKQVGEMPVVLAAAAVEETLKGLGELAEDAVGDEAAPGLGDALESEERLGAEAGEDLLEGVVGGAGHRGLTHLGLGAIHPRSAKGNTGVWG